MSYTQITAHIIDQTVQLANLPQLASGSEDVLQIRCDFCSLWAGYVKTAVFYRTEEEAYHVPLNGDIATVPHEVLAKPGIFFFGVMGVADNTRTTEVVPLNVEQGAITVATAETVPAPDIYRQLLISYATKQNKLAWVTDEDLDAMFAGTYLNEDDEPADGNPEDDLPPIFVTFTIDDEGVITASHTSNEIHEYALQGGLVYLDDEALGGAAAGGLHALIHTTLNEAHFVRCLMGNSGRNVYYRVDDTGAVETVHDVYVTADQFAGAVLHTQQTLTEEQKAQARKNIGALSTLDLDETIDPIYDSMELNYVSVSLAQDFDDEQKAQARANIGALSAESAYHEVTEEIDLEITIGKYAYFDANGEGGWESNFANGRHSQFIPVTPGDTLGVTCFANTNMPGVVYYSQAEFKRDYLVGAALEAVGVTEKNNVSVIVPDGANYAVINGHAIGGIKCVRIAKILTSEYIAECVAELEDKVKDAEYEIAQLERRATRNETLNDFAWGTFDKPYFVFVHDDNNAYLPAAYNAFHSKGVPVSCASMTSALNSTRGDKTVKEWLDLVVADGGEVLCHYSGNLLNTTPDAEWYEKVVMAKRTFEANGFTIRGLILADSSEARSEKGEKFCRRYYDYADKVGTSTQYKLGRTLMLNFASLDAFKAHLDTCAEKPGIYAFGFHGSQIAREEWITQEALEEIIDYISAKGNCEITTYGAVFDAIGTTVLEKRLSALESK